MEVTIILDLESAPCGTTTFGNFTDSMTVYDVKRRIKDRFGYPIDSQIIKLGSILLVDTFPIKQIPSDES